MEWEELRANLPEDKGSALITAICEELSSYGVSIDTLFDGTATLRTDEGLVITWQTQSPSVQRLILAEPERWSSSVPLADTGHGAAVELRKVADCVLIVSLFEPPFDAALRNKIALVQQRYPGWSGFIDETSPFDRDERDYKLSASRGLIDALRHEPSGDALLDALAEVAKTNLINWRLKDAFAPTEHRTEHSRAFADLLTQRDDAEAHPCAIADFVEVRRRLNPEETRDVARQIAEYLLFLCRPDAAIFFKHEVLQGTYYQAMARPFPFSDDPAKNYIEELRFAHMWRDALTETGYPPRDLLDVQSFLWVTREAGSQSATASAPQPMPPSAERPAPEEKTPMKTLNTILYGPPGTGKTFATFRKAVQICDGAEAVSAMNNATLKSRYAELRAAGRIGFVTFHQSYSYEEFVEGLRPEGDASDAGFTLQPKDGALREIAALAASLPDSVQNPRSIAELKEQRFWKMSLGFSNGPHAKETFEDCIQTGRIVMGYGHDIDWSAAEYSERPAILDRLTRDHPAAAKNKSHASFLDHFRNELKIGDFIVVPDGNSKFKAIGIVTGPYEFLDREEGFTQARPVKWLWYGKSLPVSQIRTGNFTMRTLYTLPPDTLKYEAIAAFITPRDRRSEQPFVLVIDEINRANISKVFGELITLLEEDKRAGAENEVSVRLPYSGDDFTLPANLHVLGTMNTADRSIALLDTALRRRFLFEETPPRPDLLGTIDGIDLQLLLIRLNQRIEYLVDRDHLIGHAFFMGCQTRADVNSVMRRKVLPLLAEYFHDDWERIVAVLGGAHQGFIAKEALAVPPGLDLGLDDARYRYTVRETFPEDAYDGLQA